VSFTPPVTTAVMVNVAVAPGGSGPSVEHTAPLGAAAQFHPDEPVGGPKASPGTVASATTVSPAHAPSPTLAVVITIVAVPPGVKVAGAIFFSTARSQTSGGSSFAWLTTHRTTPKRMSIGPFLMRMAVTAIPLVRPLSRLACSLKVTVAPPLSANAVMGAGSYAGNTR